MVTNVYKTVTFTPSEAMAVQHALVDRCTTLRCMVIEAVADEGEVEADYFRRRLIEAEAALAKVRA